MATTGPPTDALPGELDPEEAQAIFDALARELLGISGAEFLRRWDAGAYDAIADDPDHPEVMRLALLESFGR
jgi:hypothetical protein